LQTRTDRFDIAKYLDARRKNVNTALEKALAERVAPGRLFDAMAYALLASGKRLRPILCLAAAEVVGKVDQAVMAAACALEMIHTYSLIHDDLPAMDDDLLRRGRPTAHIQFDEATAILAGDALLTLAFEILAEGHRQSKTRPEAWLDVMFEISKAAGCRGMIQGQMQDMAAEGKSLSIDQLKQMHDLKTGALIEASVKTGAILAGGDRKQVHHLEIYSKNIGLAFQVTDDILNVEGDPELMGKAVGTDQSRQKSTYPGLMGLSDSKQFAVRLVNNALQSISFFGTKANPLSGIAEYIIARKR
jgi:geranylgeranyl diphosphate synthase, type II